jgi:hypothetical protein
MLTNQELEAQARQQAREVLSKQEHFSQLDREQQFEQYKSLVSTIHNQLVAQERAKEIQNLDKKLTKQQSFSEEMAASDLINDDRHLNRRIEQQGELAGNTLRQVNFPVFVKDLLKSVFDANLQVTKDQMNSYVELVKQLQKPVSELIHTIDNESAILFLAEKFTDKYKLLGGHSHPSIGSATVDGKQNSGETQLVAKDGSKLDKAELEGAIAQAKLEIVRQNQRLLEEMLLMGVNRMAGEQNDKSQSTTKHLGGDISFLSWFGANISAGAQTTDTHSNIAISTASTNSDAATDSSTKVHGEVEINFKSDYFKLDNFKDILQGSGQRIQTQKSLVTSNTDAQAATPSEDAN